MRHSRRGSAKAGLLLAILMVAVVVGVAATLFYRSRIVPELEAAPGFACEPMKLSMSLTSIVQPPAGNDGDGGEDIAPAIQRFLDKAAEIRDRLAEQYGSPEPPPEAPAFTSAAELLAAADKKEFSYFEKHWPPGNLEWRAPNKLLRALQAVYQAAIVEGRQAAKAGNTARAEAIFRAVVIYGHNLANSRVRVWFQLYGLLAQKAGARELGKLWQSANPQPDKAKAAQDYFRALDAEWLRLNSEQYGPLIMRINRWHAGNLAYVVRNHPDRAWQVEALLALGMARHNRPQLEKSIRLCLDKASASGDPYLAGAANWSINLSVADFNLQGRQDQD